MKNEVRRAINSSQNPYVAAKHLEKIDQKIDFFSLDRWRMVWNAKQTKFDQYPMKNKVF